MADGYSEELSNENVISFDSIRAKSIKSPDEYFDDANYDEYHYMDYEFIKQLEEEERLINNIIYDSARPLERQIKKLEQGQHIIILFMFLQSMTLLGIWLVNI